MKLKLQVQNVFIRKQSYQFLIAHVIIIFNQYTKSMTK